MAKYAQTNRRIYMSQGRIRQAHISSHRTACRRTELPYRRYMADDRRQTSPRYTCRTFRRRPTQHRTEAHCRPQQRQREPHTRVSGLSPQREPPVPPRQLQRRRPDGHGSFPLAVRLFRCGAAPISIPDTAHPPMSKVCWAYIHQKTPRPVRPNVPR